MNARNQQPLSSRHLFFITTVAILCAVLFGHISRAANGAEVSRAPADGVPDIYHKLWEDPSVTGRIERGVEQHRKGDATIEVVGKDGKSVANARIEVEQQTHEFLFGCNLFVLDQLATPELNRKYEAAFTNLFNFATLPFYWRGLEPESGRPRFGEDSPHIWRRPPPDRLVMWCKAHGIIPKGHALMFVKDRHMPDWTTRDDAATFLRQASKHLAGIAGRYGRDIPVWDAVNEELSRRKGRETWHAVPDDFLAWCFREAGRLFPESTKLLINEANEPAHDTPGDYVAMIEGLRREGVHVAGIGIQFHVFNESRRDAMLRGTLLPPSQLHDVYAQLGQLGLPLYITEITIPGTGNHGPALQAIIVKNLYRLWFSTPTMAGVTWWNLGDGTAYESQSDALAGLLDKDMNPKPAYRALDRLINHEWKTILKLTTDANGRVSFRGFHGTYSLRVAVGGETREFPFELKSSAKQNRATLTLDASKEPQETNRL